MESQDLDKDLISPLLANGQHYSIKCTKEEIGSSNVSRTQLQESLKSIIPVIYQSSYDHILQSTFFQFRGGATTESRITRTKSSQYQLIKCSFSILQATVSFILLQWCSNDSSKLLTFWVTLKGFHDAFSALLKLYIVYIHLQSKGLMIRNDHKRPKAIKDIEMKVIGNCNVDGNSEFTQDGETVSAQYEEYISVEPDVRNQLLDLDELLQLLYKALLVFGYFIYIDGSPINWESEPPLNGFLLFNLILGFFVMVTPTVKLLLA